MSDRLLELIGYRVSKRGNNMKTIGESIDGRKEGKWVEATNSDLGVGKKEERLYKKGKKMKTKNKLGNMNNLRVITI